MICKTDLPPCRRGGRSHGDQEDGPAHRPRTWSTQVKALLGTTTTSETIAEAMREVIRVQGRARHFERMRRREQDRVIPTHLADASAWAQLHRQRRGRPPRAAARRRRCRHLRARRPRGAGHLRRPPSTERRRREERRMFPRIEIDDATIDRAMEVQGLVRRRAGDGAHRGRGGRAGPLGAPPPGRGLRAHRCRDRSADRIGLSSAPSGSAERVAHHLVDDAVGIPPPSESSERDGARPLGRAPVRVACSAAGYLSSTLPPASSREALAFSASSFVTFSRTGWAHRRRGPWPP